MPAPGTPNYLLGRERFPFTPIRLHRTKNGHSQLFDDLVGKREQRRWDRETERLGGLEVDHQLAGFSPLRTLAV
jgi:hypothetical protein